MAKIDRIFQLVRRTMLVSKHSLYVSVSTFHHASFLYGNWAVLRIPVPTVPISSFAFINNKYHNNGLIYLQMSDRKDYC